MMHRRIAVLPLFVILGACGCGFLLSKGPPPGHEKMAAFHCTDSDVGPVLDIVWASLLVLSAATVASNPEDYPDPNTQIAVGLGWGALSGSAAVVGMGKSRRCRDAKLQLVLRQSQEMQQSAPSPTAAAATVVVAAPRDTVGVGEQVQLVATAYHSSGVSVPTTFTWSSSNDAVAAVSNSGLVTASAPGSVIIAANASNVVGIARLVIVTRGP